MYRLHMIMTIVNIQKPPFSCSIEFYSQWVTFPVSDNFFWNFNLLVLLIDLSHCIKSRYYQHGFLPLISTLVTQLKYHLLGFSAIKLPPYCTLRNFLWKSVTMRSIQLKSGNSCFPSIRMEYLHNLFGISLHRRFGSTSTFINLLNHLFISVQAHGYLFYTLNFNTTFIIVRLFQFRPLGALSVGFCAPLTCSHQHVCF